MASFALLSEFQDSRELTPTPRLAYESGPLGAIRKNTLRMSVHRVTEPGPYRGQAGRAICVLCSRRGATYLVLETMAGRLIVFNVVASGYTPWSKPNSPFGVIDRTELVAAVPVLASELL